MLFRSVAGQLEMTWTGSGSVPLTYTLLYSSDGGSTWSPIDTDVTDNSYTVDTTFITGGSKVMFRVQASDGLNNATDTVGPLTIQKTPRLVVPSGTVDFNKVLTGQGLDQSIPLRNTGNGPLTVNALTLDTATFTVSGPATPFIIAAGGQLSVAIRFKPTAGGLVTGKLTIASSDPGQPSAVVTLQAKGTTTAVPTVSLRSSALDFGNVVVGKSTDVTFVVGNLGPGDLTVSNKIGRAHV